MSFSATQRSRGNRQRTVGRSGQRERGGSAVVAPVLVKRRGERGRNRILPRSVAQQLQVDIFTLQGRLKILAVDTTISQSDRLRYYDMLAEMDDKSGVLELIAEQIIQGIEEIGIEIPTKHRPGLSERLASHNKSAKSIYGECYQPQEFPVLDAYLNKAKTP